MVKFGKHLPGIGPGRRWTALVIGLAMLLGAAGVAEAQCVSACPPLPPSSGPSSPSPPDPTPLAGAQFGALRSQVDGVDLAISRELRWRARAMAAALAPAGASGEDEPLRGLAAGSAMPSFGAWTDVSGSYLRNDTAAFHNVGHGVTALAGIDDALADRWLIGFQAGYVRTSLRVSALAVDRLEQGAVLGPYASYIINQHLALEGSLTYGRLANDTSTTSGFDSNRLTGSFGLDAFANAAGFKLTGGLDYVHAYESPTSSAAPSFADGFPTTQRYGNLKLSGEVAYPIDGFEPYLPLSYSYETTRPVDGTGRNAVRLGAGLRYGISDVLNAGLEASAELLRSHDENDTVTANLRYAF